MSIFPPLSIQCDHHKWDIGTEIASGGFGRVFAVNSNCSDSHVVKFIPKAPGAYRELVLPKLADLRNVVPVVDSGESDAHWVIVMPKAEGSLANLLASRGGKLSVDTARVVLEDIATALVSMKKGGVVHRDIKPDNILLLDGHWCLADFGISRYAEATTADDTRKYARTPPYAAPEQWQGQRATNATDVYSFGVVAYQLCSGELPFPGPKIHNYRQQHLEESPKPIAGIPPAMASLIDSCLMKPPSARPAPDAILSGLRRSLEPQSLAEDNLQAANARVARRILEQTRKESAEQAKRERKEELYRAARISFEKITTLLAQRILDLAPLSTVYRDSSIEFLIRLGRAILKVATLSREDRIVTWDDKQRRIAAYSTISLLVPRDHDGNDGRSHSLWYYKESDDDCYRWYELAFTHPKRSGIRSRINPFALTPDSPDVESALSRDVLHTIGTGKHPCPIDQEYEVDFIERWMGYFAQGA